jgi:hypothetical protein
VRAAFDLYGTGLATAQAERNPYGEKKHHLSAVRNTGIENSTYFLKLG